MPIKIFGTLEDKIKKLAIEGWNSNRIAIEVGLSEGAINNWAKKNNIKLEKRISPETLAKEPKFIEMLLDGQVVKHICIELELDYRAALKMAKKHGLSHLLRNRSESAKDRLLPIEKTNSILPSGHGVVIGYDSKLKQYIIKRENGTEYNRVTSQLFRGDPELSVIRRCTEEEVSSELLKIGYRLIPNTYTKKHTPLRAEHICCGYIRENVFYNFKKQNCPRCTNTGISDSETTLNEWIKSLGFVTQKFKFKSDFKGKGKGKEIDIFVPELNMGIEYCGLFHHGTVGRKRIQDGKSKRYEEKGRIYVPNDYDNPKLVHKIKMDKANALGITLITIFSNEWIAVQEKVKNIILAKLGRNKTRVYARNTEVKEITTFEANIFLNKYHLQGGTKFIICFGLYFNNELIAVIGGNKHHRNNRGFVLNRLCFKADTTVVGGASKLDKALVNWAKNNRYSEIISWSDNRWSEGDVYKVLGYELTNELPPDYFYFDNQGKTYSKQSCQKKNLLKKGAVGNTEWEMAQSLKLDRIYDCGKKTWVKKLL